MEVPSLREELDRKVFESLEWLSQSFRRKQITSDQFSTGIDAVFKAVAGLVDKDFINIITEAQMICEPRQPQKLCFRSPDEDLIKTFCWTPGKNEIVMLTYTDGIASDSRVRDLQSSEYAYNAFVGVKKAFKERGWTEL